LNNLLVISTLIFSVSCSSTKTGTPDRHVASQAVYAYSACSGATPTILTSTKISFAEGFEDELVCTLKPLVMKAGVKPQVISLKPGKREFSYVDQSGQYEIILKRFTDAFMVDVWRKGHVCNDEAIEVKPDSFTFESYDDSKNVGLISGTKTEGAIVFRLSPKVAAGAAWRELTCKVALPKVDADLNP
jgi:hypothetical protein